VYCGPESSQCFNSNGTADNNASPWGWNIKYLSGQPMSCEIWAEADGCDLQRGVQVGTFEMDDCSVTWNFFAGYESNDFSFYAGPCEGNDGGAFVTNGGQCVASKIRDNAAAPESYPYVASNVFGSMSEFSFTGCANGDADTYLQNMPWGMFGYDAFPIGGNDNHFIAAHTKVCPVGVGRDVAPTPNPTAVPTRRPTNSPTVLPTAALTREPTEAPIASPSSRPISTPTVGPSTGPTQSAALEVRSIAPVSSPTRTPSTRPTKAPTKNPVSSPTGIPTRTPSTRPTKTPTKNPSRSPTQRPSASLVDVREPAPVPQPGCETAFVYCPGWSTCFLNDGFNSGHDIVSNNPDESWGWNIEYTCGGALHCEIWTGAKDCNFQKGKKVGTFDLNEHGTTYKLYNGYQSNEFNFYAGQCESNDGGAFVTNGRWCLPKNSAENARSPETYPLGTNGAFDPVSQFTFSSSNEGRYINEHPWGENNYDVFPIGRSGRHWLTAHLEVCTVPH
jgi:hypothetical protein